MLDENGMIVLSSEPSYSGFFGTTYPALFRILLRKTIYTRVDFTECIHKCNVVLVKEPSSSDSAAASPAPGLLAVSVFKLLVSFLQFVFLLFVVPGPGAGPAAVLADHQLSYLSQDCCKDYQQYQRNFSFTSRLTIETWCQCISRLTVSHVTATNLLLVTDHTPGCVCGAEARRPGVLVQDPRKGSRSPKPTESHVSCLGNRSSGAAAGLQLLHKEETVPPDYYVSFQSCVLGDVDSYDARVCSRAAGQPARYSAAAAVLLLLLRVLSFIFDVFV